MDFEVKKTRLPEVMTGQPGFDLCVTGCEWH